MPNDYTTLIHELDAAWNSRDLERILSFYSEDFELTSPNVRRRLGIEDGTLRGKAQVRTWWRRVLDTVPDLSSEIVSVAHGVDSVAYVFRSSYTSSLSTSIFYFDASGRIRKELFHA